MNPDNLKSKYEEISRPLFSQWKDVSADDYSKKYSSRIEDALREMDYYSSVIEDKRSDFYEKINDIIARIKAIAE